MEPSRSGGPAGPFGRSHLLALAAGLFLAAVFIGLAETATGFRISFHPPFTYSPPGESYLWLASALLLFPAACLIGYGASPWLSRALGSAWERLGGLSRREIAALWIALACLGVATARISHSVVLLDRPISDDENSTRFGGQVLAMGRVTAPTPQPYAAFPHLFLYEKDGRVTSFDWLGPQLAWAAAEITGAGPLVFAAAAAAAALFTALACGLLLSLRYGFVAFLVFSISPMAFLLSATTHAHLVSRAAAAGIILAFVAAGRKPSPGRWALTGLAFGIGFLCRPFEITFLFLPLVAAFVFREVRDRGLLAPSLRSFVLGAAGPLALFLAHNALVTGHPLVPARYLVQGESLFTGGSLWSRFGANTGYNLFMLAVWFLGPLGIAAVVFGLRANRLTRLLGAGVLTVLLAGLLHANQGLHIVGPIHYSECAPSLAVIAVCGLVRLKERLASAGLAPRAFAAVAAGALLIGLGAFIALEAGSLRRQAEIHSLVYGGLEDGLERQGVSSAVVLASQYARIWNANPYFRGVGSWVFEWRPPRPDLSDPVLIVHDVEGAAEALRRRFPGRPMFRFGPAGEPPYFRLAPVVD